MAHGVRDASGTGPPGPAGATAPAPDSRSGSATDLEVPARDTG